MDASSRNSVGLVSHAVEVMAEANGAEFNSGYSNGEGDEMPLFLPLSNFNHEPDTDAHSDHAAPTMADGSGPYCAVPPGSNHLADRECIDISVDDPLLPSDDSHVSDASIAITGAVRTSIDDGLEDSIHEKFDAATIDSAADDVDPWVRLQDEIAEEPVADCAETIHDALSWEPDEEPVQNEGLVDRIFREIGAELNQVRQSEYDLGKLLHRLQRERAKPGSGTFLKDVEVICHEWTISRATIYRRINFFNAVNKGMADLENVRLSQSEKDAWPAESVDDDIDAEEKDAADALAMAQKKVIEEAARKVTAKRAENSQRNPAKTIKLLGLSPRDRKAVHSAFGKLKKLLGDNEASEWVAHAIFSHVQYLATHNEAATDLEAENE
jgi:hypothetical protein